MKKKREMESILIVESSYMMRLFLVNYLSQNFDVTAVETPAEAIEALQKKWKPNAVISNFHNAKSPERKGFLEMVNASNELNIPTVLLTEEDKSDQRIDALKLGAKDTLSKPFNPVELQLRIMSAMGISQQKMIKRVA